MTRSLWRDIVRAIIDAMRAEPPVNGERWRVARRFNGIECVGFVHPGTYQQRSGMSFVGFADFYVHAPNSNVVRFCCKSAATKPGLCFEITVHNNEAASVAPWVVEEMRRRRVWLPTVRPPVALKESWFEDAGYAISRAAIGGVR